MPAAAKQDVVGLFLRGVCRVRNNIVHGEKYIVRAAPRDDALVEQAHWVPEYAIARHQKAKDFLTKIPEASGFR
jgi:hypothetical protein